MAGPVHYELFVRKTAPAPWSLLMATEDRANAMETAEDLLRDQRAVAVRVTKETLDPDTMEFSSITLLTKGAPEVKRKRLVDSTDKGSACMTPQDFYAPHARELLARVLEDWLGRNGVTAYELLHRPDLVEKLEASGVEVQHAIQKVAIPESQNSGQPAHELIRHYQRVAGAAMDRVIKAGRQSLFANLANQRLADVANKLAGAPDRAFVIGGVISANLIGARGARARLARLMEMADRAPSGGAPRALVMVALEQVLCELMAVRTNLADIFGPSLDQGATLAAVVRMVAPREIDARVAENPRMALLIPAIEGPAARLAERLEVGEFPVLSTFLTRMVLRELMGPRRLRPSDARGEIDILRVLATVLTATAGRLLTQEEVQTAFTERSKMIVTADFVASYVAPCETVLCEAETLVRLCENVTGNGNKRSAARWLSACVTSLRFESEFRAAGQPQTSSAAQRLSTLAALQRAVKTAALAETDETPILAAVGAVGAAVEADAKLTVLLARASAPMPQRLAALLRLAAGQTGPTGPVAERARAEALRLFRAPESRAELGAAPESLMALKGLMKAAGMAV